MRIFLMTKILSWNCKGAYRNKHEFILTAYDPDIWVIQECESIEKLRKSKLFIMPENYLWYGENQNRGVGIFAKKGFNLHICEYHNPDYQFVIPVKVSGKLDMEIIAVWTKDNKNKRERRYIGQLYSALQEYQHYLNDATVIIGDFNWNVNFKETGRLSGNLNDVIYILSSKNIISLYHNISKDILAKKLLQHYILEEMRKINITLIIYSWATFLKEIKNYLLENTIIGLI